MGYNVIMILLLGGDVMANNHIQSVSKYNAANYDSITFRVPRGAKSVIQQHSSSSDKSLNAFINRAILQCMQDDGAPPEVLAAVSGNDSDSSGG